MLARMTTTTQPSAPFAGVTATWNYTLGSIVFLFVIVDVIVIPLLLSATAETTSAILVAIVLAATAAAATRIRYCWFLRDSAEPGLPRTGWTVALFAPALASWGLAFFAPEVSILAAVQLWLSGVLFAFVVPRSRRWPTMGLMLVLTLVPIAAGVASGSSIAGQLFGSPAILVGYFSVLLPLMVLSSLWVWRIVYRLDEARALAAELAVTQERLRFAADLHDVQGHHLQVIALKAELVERTLHAQPEYAEGQINEIRLIAKEAMEETRALVAGLREVALTDELENAREVLSLAGAACTLNVEDAPRSAPGERALAFAVREATTNILRHSEATAASITLGGARGGYELVIVNDGLAGTQLPGSGTGLAGLRDRVVGVGGTVTAGRLPAAPGSQAVRPDTAPGSGTGERFELRVWVPGDSEQ